MNFTMRKAIFFFAIIFFSLPAATTAQLPDGSPNGPVYFMGAGALGVGAHIYNAYPNQPFVPGVNPAPNSIPDFSGGGLAAGPNLNSATPAFTFYTVLGGTYWYYDGTTWIDTGHSTGNSFSWSPACGGGYIFNYDDVTGTVWRYDGTAAAIPIVTIISQGNPDVNVVDVAADCSGNFYLLRTDSGFAGPAMLRKYNSSGGLLNTYNVVGGARLQISSGFCKVGDDFYYTDTVSRHGTIVGNTFYIETISNYFMDEYGPQTGGDLASCPGAMVHSSPLNVNVCSGQLPYSWNGNNYTAAGIYTAAFPLLGGCDSIATLILNVGNTTSTTTANICTAQLPYNWNGNVYNAAGTYSVNLIGSAGCDSIATLILNVGANSTSTTTANICAAQLPYNWNAHVYNTAGIYDVTLIGSAGCDSIATLILNVGANSTSTTTANICDAQLPYNWNANVYNTVGIYNVTLIGSAGCDSIATLILNVGANSTSTTTENICASQLPYNWNANVYNAAGTYNVTLIGSAGCDSIATLILNVGANSTSTTTANICSAQLPYSWSGNVYNASGNFNVTLVNAAGCDSIATLHLTVTNVNVSVPDTLINACIGNNYSIGINQQAGINYTWTSLPAGFTSTVSNPTINVVSTGAVYYYLSATDIISGCSDAASVHIITDSCITADGIVNVYPNPAND